MSALLSEIEAEIAMLNAQIATCESPLHQAPIGCPHCKRDTRLRDRFSACQAVLRTQQEKHGLTVADINAINQLLERAAPSGGDGTAYHNERKRIADLQWKLVFLGQSIEQREKASAGTVTPPQDSL